MVLYYLQRILLEYNFLHPSDSQRFRFQSGNRIDPSEMDPCEGGRESVVRGFNARYNSCIPPPPLYRNPPCARDENSHLTGRRTVRLTYI